MKLQIKTDKQLRNQVNTLYLKILYLKILSNNQILNKKFRTGAFLKLLKKNKRKVYETKIKNRCIITGNSRSVFKRYRVSRGSLKKLIAQNFFPNIIKIT